MTDVLFLDHLVLPVTDLSTARARLTRLGFSVAADGRHPFGTGNACVFLPDGIYLEPLAVVSHVETEAAMRAPDFFAFTCQRVNMPPVDRSAVERHANGAVGVARVVLSEQEPGAFPDYLRLMTSGEAHVTEAGGLSVPAANAVIDVLAPVTLKAEFGLTRSSERGLRGEAVVFKVVDLAAAERLLAENNVRHLRSGGMVLVPREPGQGTLFAFSE